MLSRTSSYMLVACFVSFAGASVQGATLLSVEGFETPSSFGVWTPTSEGTLTRYYNFSETDQPPGNLTHNFSSTGGEGAVDLRKSGGTITSPTLTLDSNGNPDLTISWDYQVHNGTTTRRTFIQVSLDSGSTWLDIAMTQTGGGISNDTQYSGSVTITEGVSGSVLGGTAKGPAGGVDYTGQTFTNTVLVRITNQGSAGADYRQFYDNIGVTSSAGIPEPGSLALIGLGALLVGTRRRRG